jgi:hypothetical protein
MSHKTFNKQCFCQIVPLAAIFAAERYDPAALESAAKGIV